MADDACAIPAYALERERRILVSLDPRGVYREHPTILPLSPFHPDRVGLTGAITLYTHGGWRHVLRGVGREHEQSRLLHHAAAGRKQHAHGSNTAPHGAHRH